MASIEELANSATELSKEGKFEEAVEYYDQVLAINDSVAEVHLNKGVALYKADEPERALECFLRAAELKPDLAAAHANCGNAFKELGRGAEAVASYEKALEVDPSMVHLWSSLANTLNAMGRFEDALDAASKGIKANSKPNPALHNERIFSFFKMNRSEEALEDVEAILKASSIESLTETQRELYSMVLAQEGSRLMRASKYKEALAYFERACEGDASSSNLFNYGVCLVHQEKDAEAVDVLERAAEADDGSNWRIPVSLGTIYVRGKDFDKAVDAFGVAMKNDVAKKQSTVNFNFAVALLNVGGRDQEAREPLEFVISVEPDNIVALNLLAMLLIQEEDYGGAIELLQRAAKLPGADKDATLHYNLGYAKLMLDNGDDALKSFEKALKISPDHEAAKSAIAALKPSGNSKRMSFRKKKKKEDKAQENPEPSLEEIVKMRPKFPDLSELELRKKIKAMTPLERAQALLGPAQPAFLRRPSMEGIKSGFVNIMAGVYDEITMENLAE